MQARLRGAELRERAVRAHGRNGQDRGRPTRFTAGCGDERGHRGALRYGVFYGADNDGLIEPVRKRIFPIVGDGVGVSSFIHPDDAAAATVLALEQEGRAVYNIVGDEPAPVREWLPVLAAALGAKPPRRVPRWLARLFAGEAAVMMGTESRGASNAKAKRELGWTPRYPSWRDGFAAAYASHAGAEPGPARGVDAARVART